MEQIALSTLTDGLTFTADLFVDNNFLLLPQSAPISDSIIAALKLWEFDTVHSDGNLSLGGDIGVPQETKEEKKEHIDVSINPIKKAMSKSAAGAALNGDESRMKMVQDVYNEYMNYVERLYTRYATHKTINQKELFETVQELCVFIKDNRRFILRVNPSPENCKQNFLIKHSMRSTVLAIAIAQHMKEMSISKMTELGVSTILHEIGMLRLPPQIYMTNKPLSPSEKNQIKRHPVLGYSILKDLGFPVAIQLGALEHHETVNGEGYPRRLSDTISQNAKIISVCCAFEAITSPREYKDEKSSFEAMFELLLNQKQWYDPQIIKALLCTVSLYPIGSYVFLKNGKLALVIDSNPETPMCPIVQLLTDKKPDGSFKIVQTDNGNLGIARILTTKEKEDVLKAIKNKQEKAATQSKTESIKTTETKTSESTKSQEDVTEDVDIAFFD